MKVELEVFEEVAFVAELHLMVIWSFHVEFLRAFSSGVASGVFMWSS